MPPPVIDSVLASNSVTTTESAVSSTESQAPRNTTDCILVKKGTSLVVSVVKTSTITWTGDPKDYTDPYPPISTPSQCITDDVNYPVSTCDDKGCRQAPTPQGNAPAEIIPFSVPAVVVTTTFLTTDRNPAVVFSPPSTPGFAVNSAPPAPSGPTAPSAPSAPVNDHPAPTGPLEPVNFPIFDPGSRSDRPLANNNAPTSPPHTIELQTSAVIIDQTTVIVPGPGGPQGVQQPTVIVTISGDPFTINPSQVIAPGGTTIDRAMPLPGGAAGPFPPPTSTVVGGISVAISSSVAVVDGTTFTLPPPGSTTVVTIRGGTTGTLSASGIVLPGGTVTVAPAPLRTQVVVAGGELMTVAGQTVVVVMKTTITYGPGIPGQTKVVDDDTIVIGEQGVTVHGSVYGGPAAKPSQTIFVIVGGATITEIGTELVVIAGKTYTLGSGGPATKTTLTVGGETITVDRDGVTLNSLTLTYPLGAQRTGVFPGQGAAPPAASATANAAAARLRYGGAAASDDLSRWLVGSFTACCVALGAVLFGALV